MVLHAALGSCPLAIKELSDNILYEVCGTDVLAEPIVFIPCYMGDDDERKGIMMSQTISKTYSVL